MDIRNEIDIESRFIEAEVLSPYQLNLIERSRLNSGILQTFETDLFIGMQQVQVTLIAYNAMVTANPL